jgi:hypothetical protein
MSIVLITIYCIMAAMFMFGLTFHEELRKEKERNHKRTLIAIAGGKPLKPAARRRV